MKFEKFEDIIAWQKARELTWEVYACTRKGSFVKDYGLVDQVRRAAVSIGSNIAEGFDRGNTKEFLTFLGIAKGSAAEVRSQLYTALDVGHVTQFEFESLKSQAEEISRMLNGLIRSLRDTPISGMRYHKTSNSKLQTSNSKLQTLN